MSSRLGDTVRYLFIFRNVYGQRVALVVILSTLAGMLEGVGFASVASLIDYVQSARAPSGAAADNVISKIFYYFGLQPSLGGVLLLIVCLFWGKATVLYLCGVYKAHLQRSLETLIRSRMLALYSRLTYEAFLRTSEGKISNTFTVESRQAIIGFNAYVTLLSNIVLMLIFAIFACANDPAFTLISVVISGVIFLFLKQVSNRSRNLSFAITRTGARVQSLSLQMVKFFKYLKSTASFPRVLSPIDEAIKDAAQLQFRFGCIDSFVRTVGEPIMIVIIALYTYVALEVNQVAFSSVALSLLLFSQIYSHLMACQSNLNRFFSTLGGLDAVTNALNDFARDQEEGDEQVNGDRQIAFDVSIELRDVWVELDGKCILNGVTLSIPKNKSIAIVGTSGAGKTTILNVLTGLVRPTRGAVLIDGRVASHDDLLKLRRQLGYVTQEGAIFSDSIANNISLWDEGRKSDQLERVIDESHLRDFVGSLSEGIETRLGDYGANISGGQRQRIAIARELYRNPQIYIFDEATSALDSHSENAIKNSIAALRGHATVVMISHRISTIKDCDIIYVVRGGVVIEAGAFSQLVDDTKSVFADLCRMQNLTEVFV